MLWSGTSPRYWRDRLAINSQWDAVQADALAAVQQITQPLPQPHLPLQDPSL